MNLKKLNLVWIVLLLLSHQSAFAKAGEWEEYNNENGVKVFKQEIEGSDVVAFRGETTLEASLPKIAAVLKDSSRRKEWVHSCKEARLLKTLSKTERIEYNHTSTPWPLTDRDFVYRVNVELDRPSSTMTIHMKSVDDESMPPQAGRIRGLILDSKYTLTSVEDGKKTKVIVEVHVDPKGAVPKWLVNKFQKAWPSKTLAGILKQTRKEDVLDDEEVKAWLASATPAGAPATAQCSAEGSKNPSDSCKLPNK